MLGPHNHKGIWQPHVHMAGFKFDKTSDIQIDWAELQVVFFHAVNVRGARIERSKRGFLKVKLRLRRGTVHSSKTRLNSKIGG